MKNFWGEVKKPYLVLAPMDGYTNLPYRQVVKQLEPRTILFTEFVSADGLMHNSKAILKDLSFDSTIERPIVAQLFGKDPDTFAQAALVVERLGFDAVDINMGCPAKKVVNHMHGSALMKDIDHACRIIEAIKKVVSIPVSVKTRLGWDNAEKLIPFIQRLEGVGLNAVTIHGRTYAQAFKGPACWDAIYELKRNVSIPVIGNGDITSVAAMREKLGNLDGVMVGRATFGNPWLMKELGMAMYDDQVFDGKKVPLSERLSVMMDHTKKLYAFRADNGLLQARKHLVCYLAGLPGITDFRVRLVRFSSVEELEEIFADMLIQYGPDALPEVQSHYSTHETQ